MHACCRRDNFVEVALLPPPPQSTKDHHSHTSALKWRYQLIQNNSLQRKSTVAGGVSKTNEVLRMPGISSENWWLRQSDCGNTRTIEERREKECGTAIKITNGRQKEPSKKTCIARRWHCHGAGYLQIIAQPLDAYPPLWDVNLRNGAAIITYVSMKSMCSGSFHRLQATELVRMYAKHIRKDYTSRCK